MDELEDGMFRNNPLSKWYAEAWPYIIAFAVVVPILAYGVIRGTIAIILWIKNGFQGSKEISS
jgi:hypothetical protein